MCGRYVNGPMTRTHWKKLREFLDRVGQSYNVAPTQQAPILRWGIRGPEPALLRWGLIPFWAKDKRAGSRRINARSETVSEKPSFREAFRRRRCLVLADGYYEWIDHRGTKQPFYIRLTEDRPLLFFGLWDSWRGLPDKPLRDPLETFTIITTEANDQLAWIHQRMPCICDVETERIDLWLDPGFEDYGYLRSLLKPYAAGKLTTVPISTWVNKVSHDGPECIAIVEI